MGKFIVNHEIPDYETVEILDSRLCSPDNTVVIVLNDSTSTQLHVYYNRVVDIILSKAKLIVISVGKESKIRKTIMMLMATYKNYNIYKVDAIETVTIEYVNTVAKREPDIGEVQQYIGADISAYSEINTILFGIKSLASMNDMAGLKSFIEQHLDSLESSAEVIEYLRKIADSVNSGELTSLIDSLKAKVEAEHSASVAYEKELKSFKNENERLNDNISTLRRETARSNQKINELEEQMANSGDAPVITSYREVNTSIIKCKTQNILYFKEISYARYTNSLVLNIMELLRTLKKPVKMLIYDSRIGMPTLYSGISIIGTNEYLNSKSRVLKDTLRFVVAEPNPMFITDVLESISPQFDVVIVYDRMGQLTDIVQGNNVTKVYVVNSVSNFNAVKDVLRIGNNATIIASEPGIPNSIVIPEIPDYSESSVSAKVAKYKKAVDSSGNLIVNHILSKARILPK